MGSSNGAWATCYSHTHTHTPKKSDFLLLQPPPMASCSSARDWASGAPPPRCLKFELIWSPPDPWQEVTVAVVSCVQQPSVAKRQPFTAHFATSSSCILPGPAAVLFQEPWGEGFDAGAVPSSAEHSQPTRCFTLRTVVQGPSLEKSESMCLLWLFLIVVKYI